jgi:hypothetical protein
MQQNDDAINQNVYLPGLFIFDCCQLSEILLYIHALCIRSSLLYMHCMTPGTRACIALAERLYLQEHSIDPALSRK